MCFPGSSYNQVWFTRKEIFTMIKDQLKAGLSTTLKHLEASILEKTADIIVLKEDMKPQFSKLFHGMRERYNSVNRTERDFFVKYDKWLSEPVSFLVQRKAFPSTTSETSKKGGRPSTAFLLSSDRSKRRKTEELRSSFSPEELAYATQMSLRSTGKIDASKVVKDATLSTPTRASKFRKALDVSTENTLSNEKALSILTHSPLLVICVPTRGANLNFSLIIKKLSYKPLLLLLDVFWSIKR